jgi:hypothetical protein
MEGYTEVRGGGFHLLTKDRFLIAAVRRCAELESELHRVRHEEVARFRTLRRDVRQIKSRVMKD